MMMKYSKMMTKPIIFMILNILYVHVTSQQDCSSGQVGPGSNLDPRSEYVTDTSHEAFLLQEDGVISCHGAIQNWQIYFSGVCQTLTLQVWRPLLTSYQLIGQNTFDTNFCTNILLPGGAGLKDLRVQESFRIPVQVGDIIGWTQSSSNTLMTYDEALSGSTHRGRVHVMSGGNTCSMNIGDTCEWDIGVGGEATLIARDYSIRAIMDTRIEPILYNLPAIVYIPEDVAAGSFVFDVDVMYGQNWNPVVPPEYTLTVSHPAFNIDQSSGRIETARKIDHENDGPTITLDVSLSDGTPGVTEPLSVSIVDVNEPHIILNLPDVIDIDAQSPCTGTQIFEVYIWDPDDLTAPGFPDKEFFLLPTDPPDAPFSVTTARTPTGNYSGVVECGEDFHVWTGPSHFILPIVVTDTQYTAGPLNLTVHLTNLRQAPVLLNLPHTLHIREDSHTATDIYKVDSTSDPLSPGIVHHITSQGPPSTPPIFHITPDGVVSHIDDPSFDYVESTSHWVEVQAVDIDGLFDSLPANLTLQLDWVNQPPQFPTPKLYNVSLPEATPVGTPLPGLILNATDRDIVLGDSISYSLIGAPGSDADLFYIGPSADQIAVAEAIYLPPGVESENFTVDVLVVDQGGLTDQAQVTVTVWDINNHAPRFLQDEYDASILETTPGGTLLVTVNATDDDASHNAHVTYSLASGLDYCEVDATSGHVTLRQPIPYAEHAQMVCTVLATDGGSPSLNGSVPVLIHVEDVIQEAPEFTQSFYHTEVPSNRPVGQPVFNINTTFTASSATVNVTYFLIVPDDRFEVGATSGDILPKRGLSGGSYALYVNARDNGQPELFSDPAIVKIDVFTPSKQLVDIHLWRPLVLLNDTMLELFVHEIDQIVKPWVVTIENLLLKQDRAVVSIYGLKERGIGDDVMQHEEAKPFVGRDGLLGKLQKDITGTPVAALRGEQFALFQPYKVLPTYPVWWLDTIPGLAVLTLLSVLLTTAIITSALCICKKKALCCFTHKRVHPMNPPSDGKSVDRDAFSLTYDTGASPSPKPSGQTRAALTDKVADW